MSMQRPHMSEALGVEQAPAPIIVTCCSCDAVKGEQHDPRVFAHTLNGDAWCLECSEKYKLNALLVDVNNSLHRTVPSRYIWALDGVELATDLKGWTGEPWAVVLQGDNGTGKSCMATRLMAEISRTNGITRPVWIGAKDLAHQLRESIGSDAPSPSAWIAECPLLVLDDFRAVERNDGQATAFIADEFEYILLQRDNWMRPTILTMDKPFSGLDRRLVSRLSAPYALPLILDGKDRRKSR